MKLLVRAVAFILAWSLEIQITWASSLGVHSSSGSTKASRVSVFPEGCFDQASATLKSFPCVVESRSKRPIEFGPIRIGKGSQVVAHSEDQIALVRGQAFWLDSSSLSSDVKSDRLVITVQGIEIAVVGSGYLSFFDQSLRAINLGETDISISVAGCASCPSGHSLERGMQWGTDVSKHRVFASADRLPLPTAVDLESVVSEVRPFLNLSKEEFKSWVEARVRDQSAAQQRVLTLHQGLLERKIASLQQSERDRLAREQKVEKQRQQWRARFREKFFGDPFRFD